MNSRVLVVDDEQDTLNLLRLILEINQVEAITTLNSHEALALAADEQPDVILLDIMMPDLDGFELCKLIRADDTVKHIPVIFVTAYEALDLEQRRIETGADMVIQKPVDSRLLIESISTVLKSRSAV